METIINSKGKFLFVEVHKRGVIFFENMGYLIYKEPDYENWVTDDELSDPKKIKDYLKKVELKSDYKKTAIKLPKGNYEFIAVMESGLLNDHPSSQNINQESAAKIVDSDGKNALIKFYKMLFTTKHSLKITNNYAILKIV